MFNLIISLAAVLYKEMQMRPRHPDSFATMQAAFRFSLVAMQRVKHVKDVKASPGYAGLCVALDPKKVLHDGNINRGRPLRRPRNYGLIEMLCMQINAMEFCHPLGR